jgi:pimeloyl-ACP methyl ester carboxylesterase
MIKTIPTPLGSRIAYTDFGDPGGWPVFVQHGMVASICDSHQLFHRLVEAGARVICAARPGYGKSEPYELANVGQWGEMAGSLVDALRLDQLDVLGISSGAPYAYAVGGRLAARVRSLYILSGIPALCNASVRAAWPYPSSPEATLPEMQKLAYDLFFASLAPDDLRREDIIDSMANNCFGPGLDLMIRSRDWGFPLSAVQCQVTMRHSRADGPEFVATAEMTARLLPDCRLEIREKDPHFSQEVLDNFIQDAILPGR